MSELTPCNYDTLRNIKDRYGEENVSTQVGSDGWTDVKVKGQDEPVASLMEVSDHCVC